MNDVMTKERPILFSEPMVRAILSGDKTQTRRIVKPKDSDPSRCILMPTLLANIGEWREQNGRWFGIDGYETLVYADCPYGKPGDRLWVRERHARHTDRGPRPHYFADGPMPALDDRHDAGLLRSYPSIHMPRWASRITLEITDVGVDRLNEITPADARAEGITDGGCLNCGESEPCSCSDPEPDPVDAFIWLWESINGKDTWIDNPWVWVVKFRRIDQ